MRRQGGTEVERGPQTLFGSNVGRRGGKRRGAGRGRRKKGFSIKPNSLRSRKADADRLERAANSPPGELPKPQASDMVGPPTQKDPEGSRKRKFVRAGKPANSEREENRRRRQLNYRPQPRNSPKKRRNRGWRTTRPKLSTPTKTGRER